jgi:hypothetical protein
MAPDPAAALVDASSTTGAVDAAGAAGAAAALGMCTDGASMPDMVRREISSGGGGGGGGGGDGWKCDPGGRVVGGLARTSARGNRRIGTIWRHKPANPHFWIIDARNCKSFISGIRQLQITGYRFGA